MKKSERAVFLDRDGTLLTERGYLSDPEKMVFYKGVISALRRLHRNGFKLVVVTNQSGIGRGYFGLTALHKINRRFRFILRRRGVLIGGIYFCPHLPSSSCQCRKPNPGLVKKAARDLHIKLSESYVIGDQLRDLQLARRVGAKGILVLTGAGRSSKGKSAGLAVKIARNVASAVDWILRQEKKLN